MLAEEGDIDEGLGTKFEQDVQNLVIRRWTGEGRIVGIKNNLHGLSYTMDYSLRCIAIETMGQPFDDQTIASFTQSEIKDAIKTYSAGDTNKYHSLCAEYDQYTSNTHPDYTEKQEATKAMVKAKVAAKIHALIHWEGADLVTLIKSPIGSH